MKLRIVYFFLVFLLVLNYVLALKDIDNSWVFFLKNSIRVPVLYFIFFLFNKQSRTKRNILYCWAGYSILLTINLIFYAPQPTIFFEFVCMSAGAIFTYLVCKYYLNVKTEPAKHQEKSFESGYR